MKTISLTAAVLFAGAASGYDVHTKALTPIEEEARPAGSPMAFVRDGKFDFAIVADLKTEGTIGAKSDFSVRPAVRELTNAFVRCFGAAPAVYDFRAAGTACKAKYVLYVGDQPFVRELGIDCRALPSQGFALRTFEGGLVIAGNDTSLVPNYSRERYDGLRTSAGTLYGALDFCERFLDVRWYFPGPWGSLYPSQADLTIAPIAYRDAPYFNERQEPYMLAMQNANDRCRDHWAEYLGYRPKKNESDFGRYLRIGGQVPKAGMHCPNPKALIRNFPEMTNLCFYTSPNGRHWCNPKNPELCYLNVFDLRFADFLVEKVYRPYFESKGKVDLGGLYPFVTKEYVSFGQCDNKLSDADWKDLPIARELGLRTMGDVYCRFQQHLANRIAREFPGTKLFVLSYYNQADATENPKWMLPENFDVMFCAGGLPRYTRKPEKLQRVFKRAHDWYTASGNRPMSKIWLYTDSSNPFTVTMIPEFVGEVPAVMGKYLGRDGCMFNYMGHELWHYFWCPYVSFRSQWNPKLDVDAAIDEMWPRMYGPEAGAHLTRFHRLVKKGYLEHYLEGRDVYPKDLVDEIERELEAAGACLTKDSVEYKRWKLVRDYWPKAFAQQRVRASYTPPVYAAAKLSADETIVVDGVADAAWGKADVMPLMNPTDPTKKTDWPTTVRMRWDGKGLYLLATADWEALVTPDEDIWKENDMIELLFCPGLGKEVCYQFAWDFSSRQSAKYQRFLPIVQPADTNWKPAGVTSKATYGGGKWTFEAFVPFSAVEDVGTPKVGDAWNVNVVRDKSAKGLAAFRTLDSVSSAFTMGNNHRREMFGIIRFAKEK